MANGKNGKGKLIVFGIIFWYPLAGVTFQFLHYLIGLRSLGWDVYYVEDSRRWVFGVTDFELTPNASANIEMVAPILDRYGFSGKWVFRDGYEGGKCYGMSEDELMRLYREADACLNVTASQELREEHMSIPRRIYVETDPFRVQVKVLEGDVKTLNALSAHDIRLRSAGGSRMLASDQATGGYGPLGKPVSSRQELGVYNHYDLEKQGQGHDFPRSDILLDKGPGIFKARRSAEAPARWF
jgi:hypothetical protein